MQLRIKAIVTMARYTRLGELGYMRIDYLMARIAEINSELDKMEECENCAGDFCKYIKQIRRDVNSMLDYE